MQEIPKPSPVDSPPYDSGIVEAITGVPLVPEGLQDIPLGPESIRGFVQDAVVRIVGKHLRSQGDIECLDPEKIEALRALPEIVFLAAELSAANDTLSAWHNPPAMPPGADMPGTPRGIIQAKALKRIFEHSQQAPTGVRAKHSPYRNGLLTVAPPASGKTTLQALTVNFAGAGEPISDVLPQRRKALGIVHSQDLIRQLLDPDDTLQQFINVGGRHINVGAYYEKQRDGHDDYDFLLTTPESYEVGLRSGAINSQLTVRNILDEAHRTAMAPKMQEHLDRFGAKLYLFTATPAIARGRRDLCAAYPYAHFGSMREFVQDGILSPIQLYTYRAGPEPDSAINIAIQQAAHFLQGGRKTLIVCQPGEQLKQARDIAHAINNLYEQGAITPHPRFDNIEDGTIACTIGSLSSLNTDADLARMRQGKRLVATSVATGNDGLNIVDLDALVIIHPQGSPWKVDQWLGRILRHSGQVAIAVEILPNILPAGSRIASIYHSFGIREMVAGQYLGPQLDESGIPSGSGSSSLSAPALGKLVMPPELPRQTKASAEASDAQPHPRQGSNESVPYEPPANLCANLVGGILVREATIAPADLAKLPPDDYKPLNVTLPEGVPLQWLHNILDKQDDPAIRYVGVFERDQAGETQYLRYYSPAAHRYFDEHPMPELVGASEFLDDQIAEMLGVSRKRVRDVIIRLGILPVDKITPYYRKPKYYDLAAFAQIASEITMIPRAEETDEPVAEISEELGIDEPYKYLARYGITPIDKHRNLTWGKVGISAHISEAEAMFLRDIRNTTPQIDPERHIAVAELARLANTSLTGTLNKIYELSDEQMPLIEWMGNRGTAKLAMTVSRKWGEAFAEYIEPERVLPWEVSHSMLEKYFGTKIQVIHKKIGIPATHVVLKGVKRAKIYPISAIGKLIEYGLQPVAQAPSVAEHLIAFSAEHIDDTDRVAYSQFVQSYFMPAEHIAPPDKLGYYMQRRTTPPQLPEVSLSLPDPNTIAPTNQALQLLQPAPVQTPKPQQVRQIPAPGELGPEPLKRLTQHQLGVLATKVVRRGAVTPSIELPEGHVHLARYLKDQKLSCAPNLIPLLARKNNINIHKVKDDVGINKAWLNTNQGTWVPEDDAETIALAILDYPIAPDDTGDPRKDWVPVARIAAEFSGRQTILSEGDVHKIGIGILGQRIEGMEGLTASFRVHMWEDEDSNSSGGYALVQHYIKHFADRVRESLEILKAQNKLARIRRM